MLVFVVLLTILLRDVVLILLHIESSSSSIEDWSTDVEGGVQDNGLRRLSVAASLAAKSWLLLLLHAKRSFSFVLTHRTLCVLSASLSSSLNFRA